MSHPLHNVTAFIAHGFDPFSDAELWAMLDILRTHLEIAENDRLSAKVSAEANARADAANAQRRKDRINRAIEEINASLARSKS